MSDEIDKFVTIVDAKIIQKNYLKDLIRYRELFYFFVWRDILVRYKQALFGVAWAIIRPLLTMILFTLLFQHIARLPSESVPYPLFVLAGMLPWQLFSNSIVDTCPCLLNSASLISKIFFPRIIIPITQIIVHLVDFSIGILMLILFGYWMNALNTWTFITIPFFLFLAFMLCTAGGLWLSAMTVKYRDFRFVVPLIAQFGMFLSPVGYATNLIPEKWLWIYFLNPMVGIIDGFRWAFFGITHPYILFSLSFSCAVTSVLMISGFLYFRKIEWTLADKI